MFSVVEQPLINIQRQFQSLPHLALRAAQSWTLVERRIQKSGGREMFRSSLLKLYETRPVKRCLIDHLSRELFAPIVVQADLSNEMGRKAITYLNSTFCGWKQCTDHHDVTPFDTRCSLTNPGSPARFRRAVAD